MTPDIRYCQQCDLHGAGSGMFGGSPDIDVTSGLLGYGQLFWLGCRRTLLVEIEDVTFNQLGSERFATLFVGFIQNLQCHPWQLIAPFSKSRQGLLG